MTTKKWREELVNSFKAELWSCGLTAKDIDVNSFVDSLLSKERNEAMKLNYWDKEKRNEVLDEAYKEVGILYQPYNGEAHIEYHNKLLDNVSTLLENLKVK